MRIFIHLCAGAFAILTLGSAVDAQVASVTSAVPPRGYSIQVVESRRRHRAPGRRRSRAGPVPRPPDDRAARGRQDDHRRLPQGPRPRRHRHEAQHRRRPHVVRAAADAAELGDVARGADHLPRGRREGQEAAHRVLRPLSHPPGRVRRRRRDVERPCADRGLRRHRRHGECRAACAGAGTTWRCSTTMGGSSRNAPRTGRGSSSVYKTISTDGGLTWGAARGGSVASRGSPLRAGRAPVARRQADRRAAAGEQPEAQCLRHLPNDEGRTWTEPRELPGALTGDRHVGQVRPDGRLFITFRDTALESADQGRLGRLGRHVRRHRQRPRGPVSRPADGQQG